MLPGRLNRPTLSLSGLATSAVPQLCARNGHGAAVLAGSARRVATLLALAATVVLAVLQLGGSGGQVVPLSASTFLAKALGEPQAVAPPHRNQGEDIVVRIGAAGYTVVHGENSISLAAADRGTGDWRRFVNGVSRPAAFGAETITVERRKTEQYLTVERRQGDRTWKWELGASGLEPSSTAEGSVVFREGGGLADLRILPVAIFDRAGRDITPSGLRWSLAREGSSWWLELRLDDSRLPLPYVIDPAIAFRAASSAANSSTASLAINKPSGVVLDDFMVAQVTVKDGN